MSYKHMNHLNVLVADFDESVAHFQDVFGAQLILDMPRDEWHAGLVTLGTVIFELFAPNGYLLNARFGPHYIGVEYQIAEEIENARKDVRQRGIRIIRDIGVAFHTHPADTFGVAIEIYDRSFHDETAPIQYNYLEPIKPIEYWRDQHPLGLCGLKRYSIAVSDIRHATRFFQGFTNANVMYEEARPAVNARAVGLRIGDSVAELLTPVADGPLQRFLARYGDGIRSTVFQVGNLEQAKSYLVGRGIRILPGDAPNAFSVAPEENQGLLFEFSE